MKKAKIIFWSSTIFIFLFEGLMPALTGHTDLAKQSIAHLGYPDYFRVLLNIFKVAGSVALVVPRIPERIKEWAYAGLGFSLISALISNWAVDGFSSVILFPLVIFAILSVSYVYRRKIIDMESSNKLSVK